MKSLIHFRDQGCQGARDILNYALLLTSKNADFKKLENTAKRIVYLQDNSIEKSRNIAIYTEVARLLEIEFLFADLDITIQDSDIIILDSSLSSKIREFEEKECLLLLVDDDKAFHSLSAISLFTTYAYIASKKKKAYNEISINWIGDAGEKYHEYTKEFLNSTICMENYLGYAIENNIEKQDEIMLDKDTLDFAMRAGAKIFLSHDASVLDEEADIMYLSHWSHNATGQNLTAKRHPYSYEAVQQEYSKDCQIISLISDIKSSSYDEDLYNIVAVNTRFAAIVYLLT